MDDLPVKNVAARAAAAICLMALGVLLYERPWARVRLPKQLIERDLTANSTENPVGGAAISPDGRQLAYSDGKNGLTLLQIDSGEKRVLLPNGLPPLDWYPDGTHLLVGGRVPGGLYRVSTLDGSSQRLLSESDEVSAVSVSPNGMHIAFVKASTWSDLWVMGPDGGSSKRIRTMSSSPNSMISEVAWSPTSQRILYSWEELATQEEAIAGWALSCLSAANVPPKHCYVGELLSKACLGGLQISPILCTYLLQSTTGFCRRKR